MQMPQGDYADRQDGSSDEGDDRPAAKTPAA
jgi:hypothetical protein